MKKLVITMVVMSLLSGCAMPTHNGSDGRNEQNITVGTVQKEIKIGMSSADVVQALGSPNMVSTDSERREVWVYDKVATDTVHSSSSGWVFGIIAGGQSSSSASSRTQRTLTIIIKFDENNRVRDFSYHSSKF